MKGEELGGGRKEETRVGAHYIRKKVKFLRQFSLLRKAGGGATLSSLSSRICTCVHGRVCTSQDHPLTFQINKSVHIKADANPWAIK